MDRSLSSNHLRPPVLWPLPKGDDDIHCENRRLIISGRLPGSRMSRPASIWELGKKETAHARGRERGRASERERESATSQVLSQFPTRQSCVGLLEQTLPSRSPVLPASGSGHSCLVSERERMDGDGGGGGRGLVVWEFLPSQLHRGKASALEDRGCHAAEFADDQPWQVST